MACSSGSIAAEPDELGLQLVRRGRRRRDATHSAAVLSAIRCPVCGLDRQTIARWGLTDAGYVGTNAMIRAQAASSETQLRLRTSFKGPTIPHTGWLDWLAI